MKKIGIVGGVGWLSTVDYYTEICRRSERQSVVEDRNHPLSTPEMSIESLDLSKAASLIGVDRDDESWSRFDEYHRSALRRLEASGADFALIASNTPHHRFDSIVRGIGIPVLSIYEAVAKECARLEAEQVLILGTAVTMGSLEFRKRFAERGIEAAGPRDEAARALTADLIAELQGGESEGAARQIGRIARTSFPRQLAGRPIVCLACTELPLAFPEWKTLESFVVDGITYVNSSAVHITAAFDLAVGRVGGNDRRLE
jgi:aspartate racemase